MENTPNIFAVSTILIVDDQEFNLLLLEEILKKSGASKILKARDGKEALDIIRKTTPDILILDVLMPKMDGFQVCKAVRDMGLKDLPILVQTALTVPEERTKIFRAGATDYIPKPIDKEEFIARTRVNLERQHLLKEVYEVRDALQADMDDAREMYEVTLPKREEIEKIKQKLSVAIEGYTLPSALLGGDMWGIRQISENQLAFYMADFSGHGVGAALNVFRLHTLLYQPSLHLSKPGAYLTQLNQTLYSLLRRDHFCTFFYGVVNMAQDTLDYAVAASPPLFILKSEDETLRRLDGTGFPLGIKENALYETFTVPFGAGDILFGYSDGLIETPDKEGVCLSEEQVSNFLRVFSSSQKIPKKILEQIIKVFNENHAPFQTDDLTLALIQRTS